MTRDELLARLQSIELSDIEFKEAAWTAPRDSLETVSATANTAGGHLVFGVRQVTDTGVQLKLLREQQADAQPGGEDNGN